MVCALGQRVRQVLQSWTCGSLPVDVGRVIAFLKAQKRRRRIAWQRLRAVRAIEFYCRHVARQPADHLRDIHEKLRKRAQTEAGGANDRPRIVEEDLVGRIDPNEPEILQAMRRRIRLGHDSRRTERAYVDRVSRSFSLASLLTARLRTCDALPGEI